MMALASARVLTTPRIHVRRAGHALLAWAGTIVLVGVARGEVRPDEALALMLPRFLPPISTGPLHTYQWGPCIPTAPTPLPQAGEGEYGGQLSGSEPAGADGVPITLAQPAGRTGCLGNDTTEPLGS